MKAGKHLHYHRFSNSSSQIGETIYHCWGICDFSNVKIEKSFCLNCGAELHKPYIDPEGDGSIGYDYKKYCDSHCENHNEYG